MTAQAFHVTVELRDAERGFCGRAKRIVPVGRALRFALRRQVDEGEAMVITDDAYTAAACEVAATLLQSFGEMRFAELMGSLEEIAKEDGSEDTSAGEDAQPGGEEAGGAPAES